MERCRILDVYVHRISHADAVRRLGAFADSSAPHRVVTANTDFVRIARTDAAFRDAVNDADLVVADGMPLVWLSRFLGQPLPERIAGIDLVDDCASMAAALGSSLFLLGAEPGVADEAAAELQRRHAGLRIAGTYAPSLGPFSSQEDAEIVKRVRNSGATILLVAFGAPRQDIWIQTHLSALGVALAIGVGGSFNFLAGRQPRAPRWVQEAGLEWCHRLLHEPRRLWRRYLLGDLPILLRAALARLFPLAG